MNNPNRFLLIDDDETNNILCTYTIGRACEGAEILTFTDPAEGLAAMKQTLLDGEVGVQTALFLDINMPDMSGWELLDELEKLDDDINRKFIIYIMSSSLDFRDKQRAELHPLVSGYVSKPLTPDLLKAIFADDIVEQGWVPNKWYGLF